MSALVKSLALFALNWLDAQLTLVWVHSNIAEEGNGLMAQLIKLGDAQFLLAKIALGTFAAYTLYRCAHLPIARRGMQLCLTVYGILMIAQLATGLSALGWTQPLAMISYVGQLPSAVLSFFT